MDFSGSVVKGGLGIIYPPNEGKDYKWYISGIYCQLGDYILPTTLYRNLKNPLIVLMEEIRLTTWDVWNPVNNGIFNSIFTISTGAGFLPWTVGSIPRHQSSYCQTMMKGCPSSPPKCIVFRFHETILSFGKPGSLRNVWYFYLHYPTANHKKSTEYR